MQARHRIGPGNGYKSNAVGIRGVKTASRISPEGSMKGHRVYNYEHRSYNQGGCGRGGNCSRQFQPPTHPPRETDIFVEAGRLAAEYLVSKGLLPPKALSGRWRNDALKNHAGDFRGFRQHEGVEIPMDGQESAHACLRDRVPEVGPSRRRNSDNYNSMASTNSVKGRTDSFENYESEGRGSGSCNERSMASPGIESDKDVSVFHQEEHTVGKDDNCGIQSLSPGEITQEGGSANQLVSGLEECNSVEDAGAKPSSSYQKFRASDGGNETTKVDDINKSNVEIVKEGRNENPLEQKQEENKEITISAGQDNSVCMDNHDFLKLCEFDNIPIEVHSEQDPVNEDVTTEREFHKGSESHGVDVVSDGSAGSAAFHQNHKLKNLQSDVLCASDADMELDVRHSTMPGQCSQHGSSPERSVHIEQEPELGSSNSMCKERGEKRLIDDDIDCRDGFKKLRECIPSMDVQSNACLPLSSSMDNQPNLHEQRSSASSHVTLFPEQKGLNTLLFPEGHSKLSEFMQEKQLFPGSFKTCDLNFIGNYDVNENQHVDPVLSSPPVSETHEEVSLVDVDLSMSNNFNPPERNGKYGIKDTEIEVIDLEIDSAHEDLSFGNTERRVSTIFTDLDGFPSNARNPNEIPNIQQGYGMISELLGNDSLNCSSVRTDLNSLHNDIGIPTGEGILGDDDSIYMSLGEIPMSFLTGWEQPTQDYGKPF